jgi:hypothetical protein
MTNLLMSNTPATARSTAQREPDLPLEPETTPQAAWWRVEDLWLRLRAQLNVLIRHEPDGEALVFQGFRSRSAGELRSAALNPRCYAWEADGARGSLVQQLWYQGDDLVCLLTAQSVITRWAGCEDVADRMRCFLLQLACAPDPAQAAITEPGPGSLALSGPRSRRAVRRVPALLETTM